MQRNITKLAIILVILTACVGLVRCDEKSLGQYQKRDITEICVGGVIYLVYSGYKQGGITPKINADYYPYTCNNQQEKNQ